MSHRIEKGEPRPSEFHGVKEGKVDKKVQKESSLVNKIAPKVISKSGSEISNPKDVSLRENHRVKQGAVPPHHSR